MLERIVPMKDFNGIIFSFEIDTQHAKALEEILDLVTDYYSDAFRHADYVPPAEFSIELEPTRMDKRIDQNRYTFVMDGYYEDGVPRRFRWQKPFHVRLGYFNIWPLENNSYLTYAVYFEVRNRKLRMGKFHESTIMDRFKRDIDTIKEDVISFCKYYERTRGVKPVTLQNYS